jgi:hypothetical protein
MSHTLPRGSAKRLRVKVGQLIGAVALLSLILLVQWSGWTLEAGRQAQGARLPADSSRVISSAPPVAPPPDLDQPVLPPEMPHMGRQARSPAVAMPKRFQLYAPIVMAVLLGRAAAGAHGGGVGFQGRE